MAKSKVKKVMIKGENCLKLFTEHG